MDNYFLIITIIDVFVLGIMCIFAYNSDVLDKTQRFWFICSFLMIIAISLLEVVTVAVDGREASLRWINVAANYLGFGLSPSIPVFLVAAIGEKKTVKYALAAEAVFLVVMAVLFPFKAVFYVDSGNHYVRGEMFWIYPAVYFAFVFYLLIMTLIVTSGFYNKSKKSIYLMVLFLLAVTMIQVLFSHIHVSWMSVSLLTILFYIYFNSVWQQLDNLTGLFNQKSYLNTTASLRGKGILVVFDVDDFKKVNDTYGHLMGDRCLREIATCIKNVYSKYGYCYRIGGDEFCVLLRPDTDLTECSTLMDAELEQKRKELPALPHISAGAASFEPGDNVLDVKEAADREMYRLKNEYKTQSL